MTILLTRIGDFPILKRIIFNKGGGRNGYFIDLPGCA